MPLLLLNCAHSRVAPSTPPQNVRTQRAHTHTCMRAFTQESREEMADSAMMWWLIVDTKTAKCNIHSCEYLADLVGFVVLFLFSCWNQNSDIAPCRTFVSSTIKHAIDLYAEWWIAIHYSCDSRMCLCVYAVYMHRTCPAVRGTGNWNWGREGRTQMHTNRCRSTTQRIKFVCAVQIDTIRQWYGLQRLAKAITGKQGLATDDEEETDMLCRVKTWWNTADRGWHLSRWSAGEN